MAEPRWEADGCLIYRDGVLITSGTETGREVAAYLVGLANADQERLDQVAQDRDLALKMAAYNRSRAERRAYMENPENMMCSYCFHHSIAHTAEGCGLDECQCKRSWSDLRG